MTAPPARDIATLGSPRVPFEFLQSIFVAELIQPSKRLWIVSAWISDVQLVDNRARQFSSLCPDWPTARIRLSTVLGSLLERGASLVLIMNEAPANDELVNRLGSLKTLHGTSLVIIQIPQLHEKGILGDRFLLSGSMNLTYGGVFLNEELLTYTCDPARVEERRVTLEDRWSDRL